MAHLPYRFWLLLIVVAAFVIGFIHPASLKDQVFEHVPTIVALALLTWAGSGSRRPLSNWSYTLLAVFFLLHVLGAHYLYSNVPYGRWSQTLFGRDINQVLGWKRNCYDRVVHFGFGLFIAPVVYELGVRFAGMRPGGWPALLAIGVVSICGNMYEVLEWLLAVSLPEAEAENYNGQQGDVWDPQKDLAMSFVGSLISAACCMAAGAVAPSRQRAAP